MTTWTVISAHLRTRPMPPRNLADAFVGDCPLMLVAAVTDGTGTVGWSLRWSSKDQPTHLHASAEAAMDAGDRLVAKLERHAGLSLAAQAGMARDWTYDPSSVGRVLRFVHPAHPGLAIVVRSPREPAELLRGDRVLASCGDAARLSREVSSEPPGESLSGPAPADEDEVLGPSLGR